MCKDTAVNEVEQELKKPENKNVFASVNTATGEVGRSVIAPKPYWETTNATPSSVEVQRQLDALTAQLPKLKGGARAKADHRIRVAQRDLRKALDIEESERRHAERDRERQRQQVGADSPFARQSLAEAVASAVAAVNAVIGNPQPKTRLVREVNWDKFVANLQANTRAAATRSAVCCEGTYLCSKCQAGKAAAA